MDDDEIVAEVRKWREEYAASFGYDIEAIVADIRAKEEQGGRRMVSLPPRPPASEVTSDAETICSHDRGRDLDPAA